jgi:hypothetical protein
VELRREREQAWHGHAGHMPAMPHHPLSPCFPNPGPCATVCHHLSYATLAQPWSRRSSTTPRPARVHGALDAAHVARVHAAGTHWPRTAPSPRARPGLADQPLSIAASPRSHQTCPRPRPVPAVAGDDNAIPRPTRQTRKQCDQFSHRPTPLSPPIASPGAVEHCHHLA